MSMNKTPNGAAGLITINGTVNAGHFVRYGRVAISPAGTLANSQGNLAFGGGSVTNIGIYNPNNGQVTPGGTLNFGAGDMRVQGGFVRNNGTITGTGDLIIDYGGLVKGAGDIDTPRAPIRINGGQLLAGNSPGLTRVSNMSLVSTGTTGGDMSTATRRAGPPSGSSGSQRSGWSMFEFGDSENTGGSMLIEGSLSARAVWRFHTVFDGGTFSDSGVSANFDVHRNYEWPIIRPRSAANVDHPDNITPINTAAAISIFDTVTNTTIPLSDVNLNAYLRFDDSQWNWGSIPPNERGTFRFELWPDKLGEPDRVIALSYSPVPEPTALVLVGAAAGGWWLKRRRAIHHRGPIAGIAMAFMAAFASSAAAQT